MPDHEAPTFVPENGSSTLGTLSSVAGDGQPLPPTIGRYRILRLLGEGGMGAVYEAEQESPQRIVALKVIRAGYATGEMLRRFENETEALGRLQHPGIAQIYDAGTAETPFGRLPYFAMELVRGETLLRYCDAHKLQVKQRLELMAKICDAVQHAHQRGLIHRDLKPANILVGEDGQPKILDFGVARLTDSDGHATRQTDIGQLIGTLAYMSPEQVLGEPAEIDTRSDIYALGIILYELLTGKFPYSIGRQLHEAVRVIREQEPTQLSAVNRSYRGDVETIVAKALEKDKTRRYASAAELGADILRYLRDEPIVARPASATYQLQKFARRNKALVTGVAAVFVVLVLGIVASTWEAVQARRAEKKAQQQTAVAQAVTNFLQKDLLGQASVLNQSKPDPDITVRAVLGRAAQSIPGKFKDQPDVEAAIRDTIGMSYLDLGLYPQAQNQLEQALAESRLALGPDNPRTLALMDHLGRVDIHAGHVSEAQGLVPRAVDGDRRILGPEARQTIEAMRDLGMLYDYEGKFALAESTLEKTIEIDRRVLGPEDIETLITMGYLATVYGDDSKFPQGEKLISQIVAGLRHVDGPDHPYTLHAMDVLAGYYTTDGRYSEAEPLLREALNSERRVLGPEHPWTLQTMNSLALDLRQLGKLKEAEALATQTVALQRKLLGPADQETLSSMNNLGHILIEEAKYADAVPLCKQTLDAVQRQFGPDHPMFLHTLQDLLAAYAGMGDYAAAEQMEPQQLVTKLQRVWGTTNESTLGTIYDVTQLYGEEGNYAKAEDFIERQLKIVPGNQELLIREAWIFLTATDPRLRHPRQALEIAQQAVNGAPDNGDYLNALGLAEGRCQRWSDAIDALNKAVKAHNIPVATDFLFLAMAYHDRGDNADAGKSYRRGAELAREQAATDPELRRLWSEAAGALGQTLPRLQSAKQAAAN